MIGMFACRYGHFRCKKSDINIKTIGEMKRLVREFIYLFFNKPLNINWAAEIILSLLKDYIQNLYFNFAFIMHLIYKYSMGCTH